MVNVASPVRMHPGRPELGSLPFRAICVGGVGVRGWKTTPSFTTHAKGSPSTSGIGRGGGGRVCRPFRAEEQVEREEAEEEDSTTDYAARDSAFVDGGGSADWESSGAGIRGGAGMRGGGG